MEKSFVKTLRAGENSLGRAIYIDSILPSGTIPDKFTNFHKQRCIFQVNRYKITTLRDKAKWIFD